MNSGDFTKLEQAIALVQRGQKAAAYSQFKALLPANQHDVKLLLWIAYTTPSPEEAEFALMKAALVEPSNMDIARAFEWLDKKPATPAPAPDLTEQPVTITVPARNTGAPAGTSQTALLERV